MKRTLTALTTAILFLLAVAPVSTASAVQTGEKITVIVTLEEQAVHTVSAGRSVGPTSEDPDPLTVEDLKERNEASQQPVLDRIGDLVRSGDVADVTPLWIFNGAIVEIDPSALKELASIPGVARVSLDRPIVPLEAPPTTSVGIAAIGAPDLWSQGYTGQGTVIAVLDTGVDVNHPDLQGRFRGGPSDWFDPYGDSPNIPIDPDGHGTQVTSVAVGGDQSGSSIGVAPGAQFIAGKVFNASGTSSLSRVHEALQWVLDPDGDPTTDDAPDIVNNSWGFLTSGCDLEFELDLQALRTAGILPIFAAGNFGPDPSSSISPANNPSAFSVGAINPNNNVHVSSSRGPSACSPSETFPDVTAPGVSIPVADLGGTHSTATGSSFAAPHVAGAASLLLSARTDLTAADLELLLSNGAVDLGQLGPDNDFGSGRIDVPRSLGLTEPPGAKLLMSFPSNVSVPGLGTIADDDVVSFDPASGSYELLLDGSDIGLASEDIDAIAVIDSNSFLLSLDSSANLAGVGSVRDADVVRFDATALGTDTAGSFSMFFDGSEHGLTRSVEDIDAVELLSDGTLVVSTLGSPTVPGLWDVTRHDLIAFTPVSPGDYSAGSWSFYMDGSDNGLTTSAENISGVFIDDGGIGATTLGNVSVPGHAGPDEDVFACLNPPVCSGFDVVFDGTAEGLPGGADLNAIAATGDLIIAPPPTVSITDASTVEGDSGSAQLSFSVSLSSPTDQPVSVQVESVDGSALSGSDYTALPPTVLTWQPGSAATQTISVGVAGDTDPEADETFFLNLSNPGGIAIGDGQAVGTIVDDDAVPVVSYLSFTGNVSVPGLGRIADEDIVRYDSGTDTYELFFDGSDVGLSSEDINGFVVIDGSAIILTLDSIANLPDVGIIDDSDLIRFDATSMGPDTTGAFSMILDGTEVDLKTSAEDIDAVELVPDGTILISTTGNPVVPGVAGARDEDVLAFTPTVPGEYSSGTWSLYMDGTELSLAGSGEDVTGLAVVDAEISFTTLGNAVAPSVAAADEDIITCTAPGGPVEPSCELRFDGSAAGIPSGADVDAISIRP